MDTTFKANAQGEAIPLVEWDLKWGSASPESHMSMKWHPQASVITSVLILASLKCDPHNTKSYSESLYWLEH